MAATNFPPSNLPNEAQAWRRKVEKMLAEQSRSSVMRKINGIAEDNSRKSMAKQLADAGLTLGEQADAIADARRKPAAPTDPQVTTDAYFDAFGNPQARVTATCNTVIVDTNGNPIDIAQHELQGRLNVAGESWRPLAETISSDVIMVAEGLPAGENWRFRMRAVSTAGVSGEFSAEIPITLKKDDTPPPQPAEPTSTSRLGQIMLNWSGLSTGGAEMPPDFSHAEVYQATSASAAGAQVGTMLNGGDTFYAPEQEYGVTRWYYLVAVDRAGNKSTPSTRASAVAQPIVDTDITPEIIDGITDIVTQEVQENLGGTITWGVDAPTVADGSGKAAGALWFRRNANNEVIGSWEWTGSAWEVRRFADETLANLNAGKIDAGYLNAARIEAGSLSAEKMTIGNTANMIDDSAFSAPLGQAWTPSSGNVNNAWAFVDSTQGLSARCSPKSSWETLHNARIPVVPGEEYQVYCKMISSLSEGTARAVVYFRDKNGTDLSYSTVANATSAWATYSKSMTVPDGATTMTYMFNVTGSSASATGWGWFLEPRIMRRNTGELIVDGAISAQQIAANAVNADKIASNAITAAKIVAGAITTVKLDAGAVTADKLAVRSVTADKILIGNTQNQATIPSTTAQVPNYWGGAAGGWGRKDIGGSWRGVIYKSFAANDGGGQIWSLPLLPVRPGDKIYASMGIRRSSTSGGLAYAQVLYFNGGESQVANAQIGVATTGWSRYSGIFTVPNPEGSDISYAAIRVIWNADFSGEITVGIPELRLATTGELIVDGAIIASHISANAITAAAISANAVTTAKIAAGAVTATEIASNAITAVKIAADAVTAGKIATNAVTTDALAANAVTATQIAANAITTAKIAAGAVTANEIAAQSITSGRIASDAIDARTIAANAITAGHISADAVTSAKIAAGAVTADSISATAIDGKTITGALVRTAASGARTEMNTSGIRTINSSNQELVRIGYGIATGMSVRNPSSGSLVPLAPHVFGSTVGVTSAAVDLHGTGGGWGAWFNQMIPGSAFQSPTGRAAVWWSVLLNQSDAFVAGVQLVVDLMTSNNVSGTVGERILDSGDIFGQMSGFSVVTVPANTNRWFRMSYRIDANTGTTVSLGRRTMLAMPI